MDINEAFPFLQENHFSVVTTFRRSGAAQMSIMEVGPYKEGIAFTVLGVTAKLANLRRDPRCTVLTVRQDWSGYVVVEGKAVVHDWDNTDPETMRVMLRDVYEAAGGRHPDLEEYDRVVRAERRPLVVVTPDHIYGQGAL